MIAPDDYKPGHGSLLEQELAMQLREAGIPFEIQYRAIPDRRFRYDFAILGHSLLLEVNGGIWVKSGHSTGRGLVRDYEKINLAQKNGWRCLLFTADDVKTGTALKFIQEIIA